ncbi:hypothetical protein GC163_17285 [bacterium]|nr:hypothetical protein [bacterium]
MDSGKTLADFIFSMPGALFVGIAIPAAADIAFHWYQRRQEIANLRQLMIQECVATIRRMKGIYEETTTELDSTNFTNISAVRDLPSGFVVSMPCVELQKLMQLTPTYDTRLTLYFFDRWALFVEAEKRYREVHDKLLVLSGQAVFSAEVANEYWDQLCSLHEQINDKSEKLCAISFDIIRLIGPVYDYQLKVVTDNEWDSWSSWEAERIDWTRQ